MPSCCYCSRWYGVCSLDQWHANEEVAWLAFDEGSYTTNEGLEFQVGSSAAHGGSFEHIRFTSLIVVAAHFSPFSASSSA